MKRIGLTGGIATGKSTVQGMLADRGYPVLDADVVYHRLLETDAAMLAELRARFGDGCFREDGQLDRRALGRVVFSDEEARADLGRITHPRVRARVVEWLEERARDRPPPPAVFVAVPLLYESGLEALFDAVLAVTCPPEEQRRRLVERDGLSPAEAGRRMASQMPVAEKARRADAAIENGGSLDETRAALDAALATLVG